MNKGSFQFIIHHQMSWFELAGGYGGGRGGYGGDGYNGFGGDGMFVRKKS